MRETGSSVVQADTTHFPAVQRLLYQGVGYKLGHQVALGASSTVFEGTDEWGNLLVVKRLHQAVPDEEWRRWRDGARCGFHVPRMCVSLPNAQVQLRKLGPRGGGEVAPGYVARRVRTMMPEAPPPATPRQVARSAKPTDRRSSAPAAEIVTSAMLS